MFSTASDIQALFSPENLLSGANMPSLVYDEIT